MKLGDVREIKLLRRVLKNDIIYGDLTAKFGAMYRSCNNNTESSIGISRALDILSARNLKLLHLYPLCGGMLLPPLGDFKLNGK